MDTLEQDIRFALRVLTKTPSYTFFALIILAIGIGGSTALFTVVNGVLLRSLPYAAPEELVDVQSNGDQPFPVSLPNLADWQVQSGALSGWAGYAPVDLNLAGGARTERVAAMTATGAFFDVLGVSAGRGRTWDADDDDDPGVVLSDGLWRRHFAADPLIVGRSVTLNGSSFPVVGVMPASFRFGDAQLWTRLPPTSAASRGNYFMAAIGRLAPGATVAAAQREADVIGQRLADQYPGNGVGALLRPLQHTMVADVRKPLQVLLAAAGCVLLIACVNVAALMLARADSRRHELAVRATLGATRSRLIRQQMTEAILLSLAAGAIGLLMAAWGTDLMVGLIPDALPPTYEISIDPQVVAFALVISIGTGVLFGIVPALRASATRFASPLAEAGRTLSGSSTRRRTRHTLVIAELALALVPLTGAGLLLRSLDRLLAVNPGFQPDHVLTASYSLPRLRYDQPLRATTYARELIERATLLPGVRAVGVISHPPFGMDDASGSFDIEGQPLLRGSERPWVHMRAATPGYFAAAGIPLLRGRNIDEADRDVRVALIDETFARRHFPGQNPMGKRIVMHFDREHPREIVGVVGSVRHSALNTAPEPLIYFPLWQQPVNDAAILIRTAGHPQALANALQRTARGVDPEIPIYLVRSLDDALRASVAQPRFSTLLFGIFAACALVIAASGVYAMVSYTVAERRRELSIRLAVGARPTDIVRLVIHEGTRLAAIGIALGLVMALATGRF
ncbi:MAG TPA: ABC transporter permease, partial [Longimicrobiales bacterium]|nr:ABC transporter permease [Longimicrobiales bacterium]